MSFCLPVVFVFCLTDVPIICVSFIGLFCCGGVITFILFTYHVGVNNLAHTALPFEAQVAVGGGVSWLGHIKYSGRCLVFIHLKSVLFYNVLCFGSKWLVFRLCCSLFIFLLF